MEEIISELYKGKHGQSETEYQAGRSDAGKRISGDDKEGPASYTSRMYKKSATTAPGAKPKFTPKLSADEKEDARYHYNVTKGNDWYKVGGPKGLPGGSSSLSNVGSVTGTKKYTPGAGGRYGISGIGLADNYDPYDIILFHLLDEGFADTQSDAEVIMCNMSDEWREEIITEVRGLGGEVDPQTTKYTGDHYSASRKDYGKNRSRDMANGNSGRYPNKSPNRDHKPKEGDNSGLSMPPVKRAELRSKALRLRGDSSSIRRANKIDKFVNFANSSYSKQIRAKFQGKDEERRRLNDN
jgi:hypothetical protein